MSNEAEDQVFIRILHGDHTQEQWNHIFKKKWYYSGATELKKLLWRSPFFDPSHSEALAAIVTIWDIDDISRNPMILLWMMDENEDFKKVAHRCLAVAFAQAYTMFMDRFGEPEGPTLYTRRCMICMAIALGIEEDYFTEQYDQGQGDLLYGNGFLDAVEDMKKTDNIADGRQVANNIISWLKNEDFLDPKDFNRKILVISKVASCLLETVNHRIFMPLDQLR